MAPQALFGVVGHGVEAQQTPRVLAPRLDAVHDRARGRLTRRAQRRAPWNRSSSSFAFHAFHTLRAGSADVGHGQQIQRGQAPLRADLAREFRDHGGIGEVLLLRRRRHGQVLLHEPSDQLAILRRQAVLRGRSAWRRATQVRMVAAAALRDVVEEAGQVEHLRAVRNRPSGASTVGYSCACCASVNRRRLRITIRMCSSTVYTWNRSCCIWPTMRPNAGR